MAKIIGTLITQEKMYNDVTLTDSAKYYIILTVLCRLLTLQVSTCLNLQCTSRWLMFVHREVMQTIRKKKIIYIQFESERTRNSLLKLLILQYALNLFTHELPRFTHKKYMGQDVTLHVINQTNTKLVDDIISSDGEQF